MPQQVPFVLVQALSAICESRPSSQYDRSELGHVEANLLQELPARSLFR